MDFNIEEKHPEFLENEEAWATLDDAFEGEDAVKRKGKAYLPMKSGIAVMTDQQRKQSAYDNYKLRAEFPELLAPTVRGCTGLIHAKESAIKLPKSLEYLRETATNDGLTLDGLHNRITTELMKKGRYGLLAGVSKPGVFHVAGYVAGAITNWDTVDSDLTYLVLDESGSIRDPETNRWSKQTAYRECKLDDGDAYVSSIWTKRDDSEEFEVSEPQEAVVRGRERLGFIPAVIAGTNDLTPAPDEPPLYGLAKLALRVYRLDADYVQALHMTAEPTPWVSGVSKDDAPRTIGASSIWVLSEIGAKAGMLEFTGAGLSRQEAAIQNTLERAVMFGAQVLTDNRRTAESGEALNLRLQYQTSTLVSVARNSAAALERVLRYIAIWDGANPDEVEVPPNLDFIDRGLTPQEIVALVSAWQSGAYSKLTLFENLQRGEIIDPARTFEEEEGFIGDEPPLGAMTNE